MRAEYDRLEEVINETVDNLGYELVDWQLSGKSNSLLRIFIYHDKGIGIDDCTNVSKHLSELLDKEDIIHGSYILEVSSPGIGRNLVKDIDFKISKGRDLKVVFDHDGKKSVTFKGKLVKFDEKFIYLNNGKKEIKINRDKIKVAKEELRF